MSGTILQREIETYETMWGGVATYGAKSPGAEFVDVFCAMAGIQTADGLQVLDAGCGSAKGGLRLQAKGFTVTLCDLTSDGLIPEAAPLRFIQACLWHDLAEVFCGRSFDYVYCCDVLEHVPPTFTMLVAARLLQVARHGVFFSIALGTDEFGAFVGHHLHQTVQGFVDWRDALSEIGEVVECRDLGLVGLYYVRPR
jgi:SAM-dependent methyltransferase